MPSVPRSLYVKQIHVGPMMNFAYLVGPHSGSSAVLIDPSWDANALLDAAKKDKRKIVALLVTHTHFDHVNVLEEIAKNLAAPVYVHEAEVNELPRGLNIHPTKEGRLIDVAGIEIMCLHTPGHSPGSQCFLVGDSVFTGDTLFVGGCGRVDLEGGNPMDMAKSLMRLSALPETTAIYPGHDYGSVPISTIGEEKEKNIYMKEGLSVLGRVVS